MRISTSTIFDVNVSALNQQQSTMLHTQQQVSSGRRILTPADDPASAARALQVTQSDATNTQYLSNIGTTNDSVTLAESTLNGASNLIQSIQSLAVQAGNPTLADSDRKALASTLQNNLDQLITVANTKDAVGNFLFSGFKGSTQPFSNGLDPLTGQPAVVYNGDDGQRMIQVSQTRQLAASDSGADIFMRVKTGNGIFTTQPSQTNTGSGIISGALTGTLSAAQQGNTYTVTLSVAGGITTYAVSGTDSTGAALPTAGQPAALPSGTYTSGQAITINNGIQVTIQGTPGNGDTFTVAPSANQSVFSTITNLINTLNTSSAAGSVSVPALRTAGINDALNNLNNALDKILTSRASLGSRMNELDALKATGSDLSNQYKQTLSQLQDVDYNQAITDLSRQQTMLTAAQKSFMQVQGLSMFNYL